MPSSLGPLATKQAFSPLDIETEARTKLDQAATAFYKKELTKSANLFLESWRILQNEYESNLYKRLDSIQQQRDVARENKGRMLLSLIALHDLARVCYHNTEEYKDDASNCKLEVHIPRYGWLGNTTTDMLEIEDKTWPEGSSIAHALLLKDPLGRLLDKANSFNEAANIIGRICALRVACLSNLLGEHLHGYKFISDSLLLINIRTSLKTASTVSAGAKKEGDEETRKKLVIKTKEAENKENPLTEMEEKELIRLFDWSHIAGPGAEKKEESTFDWSHIAGPGAEKKEESTFSFAQLAGPGVEKKEESTFSFAQLAGPGVEKK